MSVDRYDVPEMSAVWSDDTKWAACLSVMMVHAKSDMDTFALGEAYERILGKVAEGEIDLRAEVSEKEKVTKHDFEAFLEVIEEKLPDHMKSMVHLGLTSSDILDTELALITSTANTVLMHRLYPLNETLSSMAFRYKDSKCVGRTHGQYAIPTTFGAKMMGHSMAIRRGIERVESAVAAMRRFKFAGPVGIKPLKGVTQPSEIASNFKREYGNYWSMEPHPTQVIPRDRHANVILAMALLATSIENLAVEIRHLSRSEVGEVSEKKSKGQKGSSSMPQKCNPIGSENITGLARMMRSFVGPALENVVLWHERDISHSSVERHIFPDSFGILCYMAERMNNILKNLQVNEEVMEKRVEDNQGLMSAHRWLVHLQSKGVSRSLAHSLAEEYSKSDHGPSETMVKLERAGVFSTIEEVVEVMYGTK